MKKELVVIGCSFTEAYSCEHINGIRYVHVSDDKMPGHVRYDNLEPYKVWGLHVAEKLNLKYVNLAKSGAGNDLIFAEALDYVSANHKKIGKVIIQWSGILRMDFEEDLDNKWIQLNPGTKPSPGFERGFEDIISVLHKHQIPNRTSGMNGWLRKVYSLQNIFKQLDVDYHFVTGILELNESMGYYDWDFKCTQALRESQYFDLIDKKRYIGWPVYSGLNGFCFQDIIRAYPENNDFKYWVSEADGHPNKLGHEKIAEVILNEI